MQKKWYYLKTTYAMVLDDGWFAGKVDEWSGELGDWTENRDRLPAAFNLAI